MKHIVEYIKAFGIFGLLLMGIGGLSYRTFKDGGWFGTALGKLWDAFSSHPLVMIPLMIALFFFGKLWHDHQVQTGQSSKLLPNIFLYCVMTAGAYFTWHVLTEGSF